MMGLSGSLGSVMTKFFSIRSSVVARSIPCLMSLSQLPLCSAFVAASGASTAAAPTAGAGAASWLPTVLFFPTLNPKSEERPLIFRLSRASSFFRSQSGDFIPPPPPDDGVPGAASGDFIPSPSALAGVSGGGCSAGSCSSCDRDRGCCTVCTTSVIDDIAVSFCRSS
uniref:Uncharacterized protein n=1 Tax=Arundo donax TaxID=35708 RepID=A0A0A9RUM1_ARUDO